MCLGSITKLVGAPIEGPTKWFASVAGADECIYGIPASANRVAKFNPQDHSLTLLGPDLGEGAFKWKCGVLARNGFIYCAPCNSRYILKINTNKKKNDDNGDDEKPIVTLLELNLPEEETEDTDFISMWASGELAIDNCVYFMPSCARRILKISPVRIRSTTEGKNDDNDDDADDDTTASTCSEVSSIHDHDLHENAKQDLDVDVDFDVDLISSVGEDMGHWTSKSKYIGTIAYKDNCLYGIPHQIKRMIRFDPITESFTILEDGQAPWWDPSCEGGGSALGQDGNVYGIKRSKYNTDILKMTMGLTNNTQDVAGSARHKWKGWRGALGWHGAVAGNDGCIYWAPYDASRALKYDPEQRLTSEIGNDFTTVGDLKWGSGAISKKHGHGMIYFMPFDATNVLVIDPSQEFAKKLAANIKECPEKLGKLFENIGIVNGTPANGTAKSPNRDHDRTMYEDSIAKYGNMVFTAIDLHIPPNLVLPYHSNSSKKEISSTIKTKISVPSFVLAAAAQNCSVSVIYHLMRKHIGSTTALC